MADEDMDDGRFAPVGDDGVIEGEVVEATTKSLARVGAAALAVEDMAMAVAVSKADLDQQIMTAKAHRRSIQDCLDNITALATLTVEAAAECNYALPRGYEDDPATGKRKRKIISGPSIRLMEIVGNQWGNNRYGVLTVDIDRPNKMVRVTAYHHDLETNSRVEALVTRRISDSRGRIFNEDMIAVTSNAASSIALRNAIKTGVPRPVWKTAYDKALAVVRGDERSLAARRVELLVAFERDLGIKADVVYKLLGVKGEQDVGLDELVAARGFYTALKNNEVTVEDLLKEVGGPSPGGGARALKNANGPAEPAKPDAAKEQAGKEQAKPEQDHKLNRAEARDEEVIIQEQAPAGQTYFWEGDRGLNDKGRRQAYRDGVAFSWLRPSSNVPTYAEHTLELEVADESEEGEDQTSSSPASSDASPKDNPENRGPDAAVAETEDERTVEIVNEYVADLDDVGTVMAALDVYERFMGSDEAGLIPADALSEIRARTWARLRDLSPGFMPTADALGFECYLATNPPHRDAKEFHRSVIRLPSYTALSGDRRDEISRAVNALQQKD